METAIAALILAFAGLIGLFTAVGWQPLRRLKALEADRAKREQATVEENTALKSRVTELETKAARVPQLDGEISTLRSQVNTLLAGMATVQTQVKNLQDDLDTERDENGRLREANETLKKQNVDLFEANKTLIIERNTCRSLMALVGLRLAELDVKESATLENEPGESKPVEDEKAEEPKEQSNG